VSAEPAIECVRVTVQLVDAANGFRMWSEQYDRQLEDIFEIQDEIARALTERMKVTLGAHTRRQTANVAAYEVYLKGRHYWYQRSPTALHAAIQCFEQAIKLDPDYALAYAGLADFYAIMRFYGWIRKKAAQFAAHAAVTRAMALAPALKEVNLSQAVYITYFGDVWQDAGPFFQKAIEFNPRSSLGHAYYGIFLAMQHRTDEGEGSPISRLCQSGQ
jgi:Tfp pilus assembly protein PilF